MWKERRPGPFESHNAYSEWDSWELTLDGEPERQVSLTADGV